MTETTTPNRQVRQVKLTNAYLDDLRRTRPHRQYVVWDTKETGLCVLVGRGRKHKKQATVTLRVCYYLKDQPGVPKYLKLGRYPDDEVGRVETVKGKEQRVSYKCSNLDVIRDIARDKRNQAKQGEDPRHGRVGSRGDFNSRVSQYLNRPRKSVPRSLKNVERIFNRYVLPEWGDEQVESIDKGDLADLLRKINEGKIKGLDGRMVGTFSVARAVRVQLSAFFRWYQREHGSQWFRTPVLPGSEEYAPPARRERWLDDDEIRALWRATEDMGVYGAVVRTALLTAQRFRKVSTMLHADLRDRVKLPSRTVNGRHVPELIVEDVWDAARDDDPKNKGVSQVPLPDLARKVIDSAPEVVGENPLGLVFSLTGKGPLKGWDTFKKRLDRAMLNELKAAAEREGRDPKHVQLKPWQHRDLRRTAKTLMQRAGVSPHISERCLAHVITGVEGVYDKHDYLLEKQDAFRRLADHIANILDPDTANQNVIPMPRKNAS